MPAGRSERSFYTVPEYNVWKDEHANGKGWNAKYYKVCLFRGSSHLVVVGGTAVLFGGVVTENAIRVCWSGL